MTIPSRYATTDQVYAAVGKKGSKYDSLYAAYIASGYGGCLEDMERSYTGDGGSYVDRWATKLSVVNGVRGIGDYLRTTYGR